MFYKIIDEKTKKVNIGLGTNIEFYKSIGMIEGEVERGFDGNYYLKGYAPQKPLEDLKEEKILELRKNANDYILIQYPYYKQLNIIREGTEEEKNNMSSFIDGVRDKVKQLEFDINSCNKEEEISIINYNIYDNNK